MYSPPLTTPRRSVPGSVHVPGSAFQGSVSGSAGMIAGNDLLERLTRGDLSTWEGFCDMTEYGYVLKEFVQNPEKMEVLFETITGPGAVSKRNAIVELNQLQMILKSLKDCASDTSRECSRIISMTEDMDQDASPIGQLQLHVDFSKWIADYYDAPPGNLPVQYLANKSVVVRYIKYVNKFYPAVTPREWAARLGVSNDVVESYETTDQALTLLNALEKAEYNSFPSVTKHLQLQQEAKTLGGEFSISRVYTNKQFPLPDLVALLQVYFGLVPLDFYGGNFMPRFRSEEAAKRVGPWETLPLTIQERLDAVAANTIGDIFKAFALADDHLDSEWEKWAQAVDTAKFDTSQGQSAIEQEYTIYKGKVTEDYSKWLVNLNPAIKDDPMLNPAFQRLLEKHFETEVKQLNHMVATRAAPKKKKSQK